MFIRQSLATSTDPGIQWVDINLLDPWHYDSKHRKMFRQILKATGNTPIHRILMQMHDIKYIYCHFCRKQGRRLQGQAQGIKMTNNK